MVTNIEKKYFANILPYNCIAGDSKCSLARAMIRNSTDNKIRSLETAGCFPVLATTMHKIGKQQEFTV